MKKRLKAKCKRKKEFSKTILCVIAAADVIVVSLTFVLMALTRDLAPLPELLIGMFGLTTIAVSFYYNKAKAENQIKLKKENGIALIENDFESDE